MILSFKRRIEEMTVTVNRRALTEDINNLIDEIKNSFFYEISEETLGALLLDFFAPLGKKVVLNPIVINGDVYIEKSIEVENLEKALEKIKERIEVLFSSEGEPVIKIEPLPALEEGE